MNRLSEPKSVLVDAVDKQVTLTLEEIANTYEAKLATRLAEQEVKLEREFRTRFIPMVIAVIAVAAFALITAMSFQTTQVNTSVIALQDRILAAQNKIQDSTKALQEAENKLNAAGAKLDVVTKQLDEQKLVYEALIKQAQDALRSK